MIVAGVLLFSFSLIGQSTIYYVNAEIATPGNGQNWTTAYKHLQDALLNPDLEPGDAIWVAKGTYYPDWVPATLYTNGYFSEDHTARFTIPDGVKLYGGFSGSEGNLSERISPRDHPTILSGNIANPLDETDNTTNIIWSEYNNNLLLDGFVISGQYYPGLRSPGAVHLIECSGEIVNCDFTNNRGHSNMDLRYCGVININDCEFYETFGLEATVYCYESNILNVSNCGFERIELDSFDDSNVTGILSFGTDVNIIGSRFRDNTVGWIGFASVAINSGHYESTEIQVLIENCVFENLHCPALGIGLDADIGISKATVRNCIFDNNQFGNCTFYCDYDNSVDLINCTFYNCATPDPIVPHHNYCAIYSKISPSANVNIWNSILWDGGIDKEFLYEYNSKECNVHYCDVEGGEYLTNGNFSFDPLFVDPDNHNFHLKSKGGHWDPNSGTGWTIDNEHSDCIDAGNNYPYENEPEPNGAVINMGAYGNTEYASKTYNTGCQLYVDVNASGDNNGTSWRNAFNDLQDALNIVQEGCEIWVAAGTYLPSVSPFKTLEEYDQYVELRKEMINIFKQNGGCTSEITSISETNEENVTNLLSFKVNNGVKLYGGFEGWETELSERDWVEHVTILSGNIGDPNIYLDNCTHVVYAFGVTEVATIDGFVIQDGNASYGQGGGVYSMISSLDINNCTIINNHETGIYAQSRNINLNNCIFRENSTSWRGAAFHSNNCIVNISGCSFINNDALTQGQSGGAVAIEYSECNIDNSRFLYNTANMSGGGLYLNAATCNINHCVFAKNFTADVCGVNGGGGICNLSSKLNVNFSSFYNNRTTLCVDENAIVLYQTVGGDDPSCLITNSIFFDSDYTRLQIGINTNITVSFSDVMMTNLAATYPGIENLNKNPIFVNVAIDEYHLASTKAYWNSQLPGWVEHSECSPCIDKGDYNPSIEPDASRVNMGAYGNTLEASWSCETQGTFGLKQGEEVLTDADLNTSCKISPNPFSQNLTIEISLPDDSFVNITVYSVTGQRVKTITQANYIAGTKTFKWDGNDEFSNPLPSGIYVVAIQTNGDFWTDKVLINR